MPYSRKLLAVLFVICCLSLDSPVIYAQDPAASNVSKQAGPTSSSARLKEILVHLTEKIGERNLVKPDKLNEAADYISKSFEKNGYTPERQTFQVSGIDCFNIIAEVKGTTHPDEIVLVGAHYDSVQGSPGANDNGTGTAALMLIAEKLRNKKFACTLRFVAFSNEEPPYFQRDGLMGSWVYAKACRERKDDLLVVISLETMGYFTDEPQSQKYPPLLAALYPSTGNFVGFVSNLESRQLLQDTFVKFRKHCQVPSERAALPGELQGVGWSDHWSFWQEGYQGIMVTDTALFRYPHYHLQTDTVDKIDFDRYSKVVDGLTQVIAEFADKK
jgi:Peptidase family M28